MPYTSFTKLCNNLHNKVIKKIFGTYRMCKFIIYIIEQANWDKFFQIVTMFAFLRADVLLQRITNEYYIFE